MQNKYFQIITNTITVIALVLISLSTYAQRYKNVFPVGTYHAPNTTINGISGGFISTPDQRSNTNGLKIEMPGAGIVLPLVPRSPISTTEGEYSQFINEPVVSRVNGMILSPFGTTGKSNVNGVSLGYIAQLNGITNGISASMGINFAETHNGIQLGGIFNIVYKANGLQISAQNSAQVSNGIQAGIINSSSHHYGLQIGLVNRARHQKGLQLGLWNENEKRKLPFINWNI